MMAGSPAARAPPVSPSVVLCARRALRSPAPWAGTAFRSSPSPFPAGSCRASLPGSRGRIASLGPPARHHSPESEPKTAGQHSSTPSPVWSASENAKPSPAASSAEQRRAARSPERVEAHRAVRSQHAGPRRRELRAAEVPALHAPAHPHGHGRLRRHHPDRPRAAQARLGCRFPAVPPRSAAPPAARLGGWAAGRLRLSGRLSRGVRCVGVGGAGGQAGYGGAACML
jgi:hypothetical protein